ncbi:Protein FRA10AC1 [Leucoagaricus sp. SymC.cos]|nr:Protein FRA10AC1 [Leucoagaricus sp. SymC.cos]
MSIYPTKSYPITKGLSEFEILKASHRFLREDSSPSQDRDNEEGDASTSTRGKRWEDQLAETYYENLYREFAVCDLKHYKSGNFALRWRTESEVLSGAGESTCGNTRCKYHFNPTPTMDDFGRRRHKKKEPQLTTLELPFAYIEHGEPKSALVKVVLCTRCGKKLMWKRKKDKDEKEMKELGVDPAIIAMMGNGVSDEESEEELEDEIERIERKGKGKKKEREKPLKKRSRDYHDRHEEEHERTMREPRSRRRRSRSRSPRRHTDPHSHSYFSSRRHSWGHDRRRV